MISDIVHNLRCGLLRDVLCCCCVVVVLLLLLTSVSPTLPSMSSTFSFQDVVGFLDRKAQQSLHLVASKGSILSVLVENQGRTNFGAAIRDNRKVCHPAS